MTDAPDGGTAAGPRWRVLAEVAAVFLKLGLIGFGGPAAHMALMRDELVRRRGWVSDQRFLDLMGAVNFIPGPNSTELAIHLGHDRARSRGLIVAGVCFILPAFAIVTALAWAYVRYGTTPAVAGLLYAVKPVVVAIVVWAIAGLLRTAVKDRMTGVAAAAGLAAYLLGVNELAVLAAGGLLVTAVRTRASWLPGRLGRGSGTGLGSGRGRSSRSADAGPGEDDGDQDAPSGDRTRGASARTTGGDRREAGTSHRHTDETTRDSGQKDSGTDENSRHTDGNGGSATANDRDPSGSDRDTGEGREARPSHHDTNATGEDGPDGNGRRTNGNGGGTDANDHDPDGSPPGATGGLPALLAPLAAPYFPDPTGGQLAQLFLTFLKIGAVLYGSGYVLLAFLEGDLVERLGWITNTQLLDAVSIGQVTPGPVFTTATFIGYLVMGLPGAVLATIAIFLPSFVFVGLLTRIIDVIRNRTWSAAFLDGVNATALALMTGVTLHLARDALVDPLTVALAVLALLLQWRTRLNTAWLIGAAAALGAVRALIL
jgi:chromate transport protein ChrA